MEVLGPFTTRLKPGVPWPAFMEIELQEHTLTLSNRQAAILEYLRRRVSEGLPPPTIREIGKEAGISSTSVVAYNLEILRKEGHIFIYRGISRGIILRLPETAAIDELLLAQRGREKTEALLQENRDLVAGLREARAQAREWAREAEKHKQRSRRNAPLKEYLKWALDLLDRYDERLAEIDGAEMIYTQAHTKAKKAARELLGT